MKGMLPGGPHLYETIPLFTMGLAVGIWLVASHLFLLKDPEGAIERLREMPRNYTAGVVVSCIAFVWFWLLVAPSGLGVLSRLEMNLGDFNAAKPILRIVVPIALYLFVTQVREFLFVRGLGILLLMVAAPILDAAFLKEPSTRLLLPVLAYAMIIKGFFYIGKPYLFRDQVNWATASQGRFKLLVLAGLGYGVLVLACAFLFWR